MAYVAREKYDRNLMVVSPRIETPVHKAAVWDSSPNISHLMRYSTGIQGDKKPLILGNLPPPPGSAEELWYVIKPVGKTVEYWNNAWAQ
jgi:hypothetical protein